MIFKKGKKRMKKNLMKVFYAYIVLYSLSYTLIISLDLYKQPYDLYKAHTMIILRQNLKTYKYSTLGKIEGQCTETQVF